MNTQEKASLSQPMRCPLTARSAASLPSVSARGASTALAFARPNPAASGCTPPAATAVRLSFGLRVPPDERELGTVGTRIITVP